MSEHWSDSGTFHSSNPGQYNYLSLSKLKSVWTKAKEIHCEIENDRYSRFYNLMMNDVSKSLHGLCRFRRDNDKCDDELDE